MIANSEKKLSPWFGTLWFTHPKTNMINRRPTMFTRSYFLFKIVFCSNVRCILFGGKNGKFLEFQPFAQFRNLRWFSTTIRREVTKIEITQGQGPFFQLAEKSLGSQLGIWVGEAEKGRFPNKWDISCIHIQINSGWWQLKYFYFHPYLGNWSNLTNIFQMGWNHQLELVGPSVCDINIEIMELQQKPSRWTDGMKGLVADGRRFSNLQSLSWLFWTLSRDGQTKQDKLLLLKNESG